MGSDWVISHTGRNNGLKWCGSALNATTIMCNLFHDKTSELTKTKTHDKLHQSVVLLYVNKTFSLNKINNTPTETMATAILLVC